MSGLKIESLVVENCKALLGPITFGPFDPNLTVITGENEAGKSTSVEALRCALFEKHDANLKVLRELRPRGTKFTPKVTVVFTVGGKRHELTKTFLDSPQVELNVEDGLETLTGTQAEARLRELLNSKKPGRQGAKRGDMGVWGLLWVTQDEAAYSDPGDGMDAEARGGLQEAISKQVGQVLGGKHGERIREAAKQESLRYWTAKTGKASGELSKALAAVAGAEERCKEIQAALRKSKRVSTRASEPN